MKTDRRSLLKGIAAATAAVSAAPITALARPRKTAGADAVGMLYDATKCIGCKTCVVACKEEAGLPADTRSNRLYDAPDGLNEYTKNVIQLYKGDNEYSYVKKQCMHCIDPACVGACMLGALKKGDYGVVSYEADTCIGCRYCEVACPFNVPKFEWSKSTPKIVKCELCKERLAKGLEPACTTVCPAKAIIFGKRDQLLKEAHDRIDRNPNLYFPKVYGEEELGGTQVLYLSHVPFEKLGFRFDDKRAVPDVQQTIQHGVYQGFAAPIALYAVLGAVIFRNRKKSPDEE
jgi:Fe-S-cluster-containing dehydrogenase component